jgi:hypothetical protein
MFAGIGNMADIGFPEFIAYAGEEKTQMLSPFT